jgi:hypothetical protein
LEQPQRRIENIALLEAPSTSLNLTRKPFYCTSKLYTRALWTSIQLTTESGNANERIAGDDEGGIGDDDGNIISIISVRGIVKATTTRRLSRDSETTGRYLLNSKAMAPNFRVTGSFIVTNQITI